MIILLDAMGGDNAPDANIKGAVAAINQIEAKVVLIGKEEVIKSRIKELYGKEDIKDISPRLSIKNATETIEMEDIPTQAIKHKKDSSMVVGFNMLKQGEGDVFISAGNSGALLTGATLLVVRMKGIDRPALALSLIHILKDEVGNETEASTTASTTQIYTVTYYVDSGNTRTQQFSMGQSVISGLSFTPSKSGYSFVGWREDKTASSSVLSSKTMGTSNMTLYAVFSQTITLSYNGNGATGGSTASQSGTRYYNNGNATNPSFSLRSTGFSRTNYTFANWTIGSTSGTQYSAGASVTLSANTTFYARWIQTAYNYGYTGGVQSFTAPVTGIYRFQVYGAAGGGVFGGKGGYAIGYKQVNKGTVLYICVGGAGAVGSNTNYISGGYNGGGSGSASNYTSGGGGGCTHIATRNGTLQALGNTSGLYIVAGGGGGARYMNNSDSAGYGGTGGGTTGGSSQAIHTQGGGGTQSGGGSGVNSGSFGKGGNANSVGAGGGGGLYGGGGSYGNGAGGDVYKRQV